MLLTVSTIQDRHDTVMGMWLTIFMNPNLENNRSNQALNPGGAIFLLLSFLQWKWSLDDILPHIILLRKIEQLPDLGSSLGSQAFWNCHISQSRDFLLPFLHNNQSQDRKVGVNNTASDRLAFPFTITSLTIAGVPFGEEKTDTT